MVNMQRAMDRLFDEFSGGYDSDSWTEQSSWTLPVDVTENEDGYELTASLPGVNEDNIEVTLNDNVLNIRAEMKAEEEREGDNYHIRERRWGTFNRSLRLPAQVNSDAVEANYENGVLKLRLPKAEEVKPRRIAIGSNGEQKVIETS
jgi:HSP20 family protein